MTVESPGNVIGKDLDNSDLAWVIPIILLVIAASVGLGLLIFYCIRRSELWCIRCVYRCCGACANTIHKKYKSDREEYQRLRKNEETGVKMRLQEFNRSYSAGIRNTDAPDV